MGRIRPMSNPINLRVVGGLLALALLPEVHAQVTPALPVTLIIERGVPTSNGIVPLQIRHRPSINSNGALLISIDGTQASPGAIGIYRFDNAGLARVTAQLDVGGSPVTVTAGVRLPPALADDGSFGFWALDALSQQTGYFWRNGTWSVLAVEGGPDGLGGTFTGLLTPHLMTHTGLIGISGSSDYWLLDGNGTIELASNISSGLADTGEWLTSPVDGLDINSSGTTTPIVRVGDTLGGGEVLSVNTSVLTPLGYVYFYASIVTPVGEDCFTGTCTQTLFRASANAPPVAVFAERTTLPGTGGLELGVITVLGGIGPGGRVGLEVSLNDPNSPGGPPMFAAIVVDATTPTVIAKTGDSVPYPASSFVSSSKSFFLQPAGPDRVYLTFNASTDPTGVLQGEDVLWVYEGGVLAPIMAEGTTFTLADGSTRTLTNSGVVFRMTGKAGENTSANVNGELALLLNTVESTNAIVVVGRSPVPTISADLAASGTVAVSGRLHVYEITVTNNGPDPVDDYEMVLTFPAGFVSVADPPPECPGVDGGNPVAMLVCGEDLFAGPAVAVGASRTFTYSVTAPDDAVQTADLVVSWSGADLDSTNDSVSIVGGANSAGLADLSVTIDLAERGVRVVVSNAGPDEATGGQLGLTQTSIRRRSSSGFFKQSGSIDCTMGGTCTFAALPAGQSVDVHFHVAESLIEATVSGEEVDPNPADNQASVQALHHGCSTTGAGGSPLASVWFAILAIVLARSRPRRA